MEFEINGNEIRFGIKSGRNLFVLRSGLNSFRGNFRGISQEVRNGGLIKADRALDTHMRNEVSRSIYRQETGKSIEDHIKDLQKKINSNID